MLVQLLASPLCLNRVRGLHIQDGAAATVMYLADWAWSVPATLSPAAVALRQTHLRAVARVTCIYPH
jgi:hypothetical protein